jgi:hypothetical protein
MVATFISQRRDLRTRPVLARRVRLFALAVAGLAAVNVVRTCAVIVSKQTKEAPRSKAVGILRRWCRRASGKVSHLSLAAPQSQ